MSPWESSLAAVAVSWAERSSDIDRKRYNKSLVSAVVGRSVANPRPPSFYVPDLILVPQRHNEYLSFASHRTSPYNTNTDPIVYDPL